MGVMHVQNVSTDREDCTDSATHCYTVIHVIWQSDVEHTDPTLELAGLLVQHAGLDRDEPEKKRRSALDC